MRPARRWLAAVSLGDPLHQGSLTIFPLLPVDSLESAPPAPGGSPSWPTGNGSGATPKDGPRYVLLSDAIEAGTYAEFMARTQAEWERGDLDPL